MSERCYCGHLKRRHIGGKGMCLVCPGLPCLIFRATPARPAAVAPPTHTTQEQT